MWLRIALILSLWASLVCAASVQWNASIVDAEHGAPDGYRVYYGYAVDQLTTAYDVGNQLDFAIPETWNPATYYFGVRAYNQSGESGWATTPEGQTWVSYTKANPPPVLPPEPATDVRIVFEPIEEPPVMAIERVGNVETAQVGWISPYSFAVNIPSDAEVVVLSLAGFNYNVSGATLGSQSFTIVNESTAGGSNDDVAQLVLFSPDINGSQNISVAFSSAHGNESRVYASYWKGVNTADGLRDSDIIDGSSLTLTAVSGDVVVLVASADSSTSWTNATELSSGAAYGVGDTSLAYLTADGTSETVSCTDSSTGLSGIVLRMASGGGASAVPIFGSEISSKVLFGGIVR